MDWRRPSSTLYGRRRTDARHRHWPHAGTHLVRYPVLLHHVVDFVETAGLALHDEEPERVSRLFDETIADFPIGICRPWARGKCRQRGLKPPSEPPER